MINKKSAELKIKHKHKRFDIYITVIMAIKITLLKLVFFQSSLENVCPGLCLGLFYIILCAKCPWTTGFLWKVWCWGTGAVVRIQGSIQELMMTASPSPAPVQTRKTGLYQAQQVWTLNQHVPWCLCGLHTQTQQLQELKPFITSALDVGFCSQYYYFCPTCTNKKIKTEKRNHKYSAVPAFCSGFTVCTTLGKRAK